MKKKISFFISLAIITSVVSYSVYMSTNNNRLSNLALANIEAFADNSEGDFEIVCNRIKNTKPGNCWQLYGECPDGWFHRWDDCRFSGGKYDRCLTPCD